MVEFPMQKIRAKNEDNVGYKIGAGDDGCPQAHPAQPARLSTAGSTGDPQEVGTYDPQGAWRTLDEAGVIPGGWNPRGSVDRHPRLANREVFGMPDATHQTAPAARCPHCGVAPDRRAPRPPSTKEAALAFIAECRRKLRGSAV